ncbi:unnamed protein product [Symbiodinium microadriaticum]|nr:unnamed protein product [Symbiodinium microadriaticum]
MAFRSTAAAVGVLEPRVIATEQWEGSLDALTLFDRILQEIRSHSYEVGHQLRMNESTVLLKVTVIVRWFPQCSHGVESHLELNQWKSAFCDLFNTIDGYVASSRNCLETLDIDTIAAASEIAMRAFVELCRQYPRVRFDLLEVSTAFGWLITNRYTRIMTPEFAYPHCGPAEHSLLCVIKFARSLVRMAVRDGRDPLSAFPCHIDLSRLVFDKTSESYEALRALFRRRVTLKTFGPFEHVKHDTLTSSYVYLALPLSLAEGLISGLGARIPFPLGQINAMYCIESAIRKLAHWYRQDCFSPEQIEEDVAFLCFRPIIAMTSTDLKHPSGRRGFQKYHNCIPPLALFGSDCVEICAKAIESEAIGVENCDELNEDECKILIRAASAIARKRKFLTLRLHVLGRAADLFLAASAAVEDLRLHGTPSMQPHRNIYVVYYVPQFPVDEVLLPDLSHSHLVSPFGDWAMKEDTGEELPIRADISQGFRLVVLLRLTVEKASGYKSVKKTFYVPFLLNTGSPQTFLCKDHYDKLGIGDARNTYIEGSFANPCISSGQFEDINYYQAGHISQQMFRAPSLSRN